MLYRKFMYKYFLTISHTLSPDTEPVHQHTWELQFTVLSKKEEDFRTDQMKLAIEEWAMPWELAVLNEKGPFRKVLPTAENACHYFLESCQQFLYQKGYVLVSLSIRETPWEIYQVSGIGTEDFTFL